MVPPIGVLGTERDSAVLLIASCWPSSILCRTSTASLQCIFHYFPPPSPHATQGEQMPVFHLAVPAPQYHLGSRSHSSSSSLLDSVPAKPEQLPSVAPSRILRASSLREVRHEPQRTGYLEQSWKGSTVILSSNVQLWHNDNSFFLLQKRQDKLLALGFVNNSLNGSNCYASDPSKGRVWQYTWNMLAVFHFGINMGKAVGGLYPGLMVNKVQDKKKKSMCQRTLLFCLNLLYHIHHFMASRQKVSPT